MSRWSASWRAALRLAARDGRRHKAASVMIMVMVGLPVVIIGGGAAALATTEVTTAESLPVVLGRAQAVIRDEQSGPLQQSADGEVLFAREGGSPPVAGHQPGQAWTADQVQRLTGGTVGISATTTAFAEQGGAPTRVEALVLSQSVLAGSGLVELVRGRLPNAPGEVAVTEAGASAGLPASGRLQLRVSAQSGPSPTGSGVQVTGVVRAVGPDFRPVGLVIGAEWLPAGQPQQFLVLRDHPVGWAEVEAWNAYGLSVLSRSVVLDPPLEAPAGPPRLDETEIALVTLICLGLVLETALLAGPAFAVSAARRRRSLALVASNGAERAQLTRYVLAQGVVLGGVAVLLGAVLGTGLGWLALRLVAARLDGRITSIGRPPLDTYLWATALIVLVAFLAAVVSAAVPGRHAARLDIAATLAGRTRSRRVRPGLPIVGAGAMAVGATLVVLSLQQPGTTGMYLAGIGGAVLILGSLLVLPLLLAVLGHGLRRVPPALRIAGRDITRLRSRSVPAVAAITVVVAVLTMLSVGAASDDADRRRDYQPSTLPGRGLIPAHGEAELDAQLSLDKIRGLHPDWAIEGSGWLGQLGPTTPRLVSVNAVPARCAAADVVGPLPPSEVATSCQQFRWDVGWSVQVPAALNPRARLTSEQQAQFDRGTLLVTSPELLQSGTVRLAVAAGGIRRDGNEGEGPLTLQRVVELPAALISREQYAALTWTWSDGIAELGGAVISARGAEQAGLPWTVDRWEVADPSGPISRTDEAEINAGVYLPMSVERGYSSSSAVVLGVLFGIAGALVAVGALISTALARIEAQAEHATLAALGASPVFRRLIAAAQAGLVAVVGATLGVLLGLAPGIAMARSLTTGDGLSGTLVPPTVAIPVLGLLALIAAVPLSTAALGALMGGGGYSSRPG